MNTQATPENQPHQLKQYPEILEVIDQWSQSVTKQISDIMGKYQREDEDSDVQQLLFKIVDELAKGLKNCVEHHAKGGAE